MIYARNDIQSVNISQAHGGCGVEHRRPEGEQVWGLSCGPCEDHLRTDALWSATLEELPSTHDEQRAADSREKNFAKRQFHAAENAAGVLALLAGPQDLLAGTFQQAAQTAECHKCAASVSLPARFCGRCGAPMLGEIGATA